MQNTLNYLRIVRGKNIGRQTFFTLLEHFGSVEAIIEQLPEYIAANEISKKLELASIENVERELKQVEKFAAQILTFDDPNYPSMLRNIPDCAPLLTVKGKPNFLQNELQMRDCIAIVGTRNASLPAINFTKKLAANLSNHNAIITSGMARGIDGAAHEASIKNGTIAVIAGGIDNIYPKEHKKLYEEIIENGLVISEQPFGAPPQPANFLQRNRLISGLALGVVVVEAKLQSGSLVTARLALEQNREVFAVPGAPYDSRCSGTNHLIRQGAKLTESIDDILSEISLRNNIAQPISPSLSTTEQTSSNKIHQEILQKLSFSAIDLEELLQNLQAPTKLVNIALAELEMMERIEISFNKIRKL